jgi:integrase
MELAGHSQIATTMQLYVHASDETKKDATALLGDLFTAMEEDETGED